MPELPSDVIRQTELPDRPGRRRQARNGYTAGMDHEPAPWWSDEDANEVNSLLVNNGYGVDDDQELVQRYSNY